MFRDASGAPVTIRKKLGEGGEGIVFAITERSDTVAKIYSRPLSAQQTAKLEQMVAVGDDTLEAVAAWPTGLLYKGSRAVGFTMPRLSSQHPLHDLFGPKQRQALFPNAHWKFLVHTAINLARAFEVVHDRSIVVGDVNSNNVVVYGDSTARLIDCDSFQIQTPSTVFRCNVGVAEYQPPELQGRDFSTVDRLPQHDLFGLAVMIFQLLFVGKHPFAGILPANMRGNAAIGANVAARRYFYAQEGHRIGLRPPPGSLALSAITPEASHFFKHAFLGDPARRPSAVDWRTALAELKSKTVVCSADAAHHHLRDMGCPWCALEADGLYYFNSADAGAGLDDAVWKRISDADVDRAWAEVVAVRRPPRVDSAIVRTRKYVKAPLNLYTQRRRAGYAAGAAVAFVTLAVLIALHHPLAAFYAGFAAFLAAIAFRPNARGLADRAWKRCGQARRAFRTAEREWVRNAHNERFAEELARLSEIKTRLSGQRARYDAELAGLQRSHEIKACEKYLAGFRIAKSRIPEVGPQTRILLFKHGIETAADVTPQAIARVPKLRKAAKYFLLSWRYAMARQYRHDPANRPDSAAVREIKGRHARERSENWSKLAGSAAMLRQIAVEIQEQRAALERAARERADEMWQAEADSEISPFLYWKDFV